MVDKKSISTKASSRIEKMIYFFRGQRVMLDSDLADLFGVTTSRMNEQVKRNIERFPEDFMFQLNPEEVQLLRSQIATSNSGRGGRRYTPYVFTEHGAVMLANVLRSPVAVQASIQVVRAFVNLREMLATNQELARKFKELEQKYDKKFAVVFQAIRELMKPEKRNKPPIGFRLRGDEE